MSNTKREEDYEHDHEREREHEHEYEYNITYAPSHHLVCWLASNLSMPAQRSNQSLASSTDLTDDSIMTG